MKTILLGFLLTLGINFAFAQKKQKRIIPKQSGVKIDADLNEWGNLVNVAEEGFWFYELAQDESNLYVAIRVENVLLQGLAVRNGLLLTVQSTKKNKNDIHFLFPYPDAEVKRAMKSEEYDSDEARKLALISRSRGYFVYGFPTVPNGLLSLHNGYGVEARAEVREGKLFYEAVVPKSLLDYTKPFATLKLSIYDGFTSLITTKKSTAPRPYGATGNHRVGTAPRSKDKLTLAVLLETTLD